MKKLHLAIIGATGIVGRKILAIITEQNLPFTELTLYGSSRSAGQTIIHNTKSYQIQELTSDNINADIDLAFFAAGGDISKLYVPLFTAQGIYVVDNSSMFRQDDDIPLVIPEINAHVLKKEHFLVANPNCSTTQALLPLFVLQQLGGLQSIDYTTYQAVSGSGKAGVDDLIRTKVGETPQNYPYSIADNLLPHIDVFLDHGFTKEEIKMVEETQKILENDTLAISATCVRVPIKNTHAVSVIAQTKSPIDLETFRNALQSFNGITLYDNPKKLEYPLAQLADEQDNVFVGRIRQDLFNPCKIHFYCVADNLRKGAATNSVQIGKAIIKQFIINEGM